MKVSTTTAYKKNKRQASVSFVLAQLLYGRGSLDDFEPLLSDFPEGESALVRRVATGDPEFTWQRLFDGLDSYPEPRAILDAVVEMEREQHLAGTAHPVGQLGFDAFHGPLGDYVLRIEPHTEADRAAILLQTIVLAGNVLGRNVYFLHENDKHYTNLFCGIVGPTSKGRKGVSLGQASRLFHEIDPEWERTCKVGGLSSGEGIVHAVRDWDQDNGTCRDKRLMVIESEFASVLKAMTRQGNTLSPMLRQAWDTGDLQTLTKNDPLRVRGVHISILGHITAEELRRNITETEIANGFANRFLWGLSRRSKLLPNGGRQDWIDWVPLRGLFERALQAARDPGQIRRSAEADRLWRDVYLRISAETPGLFGAVTSRSEAQVTRLSAVYALMDCSRVIKVQHLRAALAVWRYCETSARHIFGGRTGNRDADRVLASLRASDTGLTRTEISVQVFHRNLPASRIETALALLRRYELAHCVHEGNGKAQTERWFSPEV